LFTDAGSILVATVPELDDHELEMLAALNRPNDVLVVTVGEHQLGGRTPAHLSLPGDFDPVRGAGQVEELLRSEDILVEYNL
ncbi:MAG: hypothetical protein ACRDL8_12065, partial [Solirubrobacteraceae bacterium]